MTPPPAPPLRLLFWETTIACNLACAHCRRVESNEDAVGDLTTPQALAFIGDVAELGRHQAMMPVLVFSGGEPLCRLDLFDLIGSARGQNIFCALATNGTLIDARLARGIANSGVTRVSISLDGATEEVHDGLRQLPGSFSQALVGITHLREQRVPFQINMMLTRQNAHQLQAVYNLAGSLGAVAIHIFMLVPVGCGQILAETDMLSPEEYERKLIEISRLDGQGPLAVKVTCAPHYERILRQQGLIRPQPQPNTPGGSMPSGHPHGPNAPRGCLAGQGVLFVGHQGDVFPCGYLPIFCGNIRQEKLLCLWQQQRDLTGLRDRSCLQGKCGVCGYRELCGGCRGRAYGATGNYLAQEPFCSYRPPQAPPKGEP